MSNNKNAMQLAASGSLIGRVLTPADFSALDSLIKNLGDKAVNLKPEEKEGAIQIIDEWNQSVTQRIQYNAEQAKAVLAFLDGQAMYGGQLQEVIELFHEAIGDTREYAAYLKAVEEYAAIQADEPVSMPVGDDTTIAQADRINAENYAADLAHNRKVRGAEYKFNKAVKAYIKSLQAIPEVQSLRGALTSYKNKAVRMAAECSDKASRAKLNVTIDNPEVRKLLHELMDFAQKV